MNTALAALQAVDFNWTRALRDVWTDPLYHVDDLNKSTVDAIIDDFHAATRDAEFEPGRPGHSGPRRRRERPILIGMLRRRVWEAKGWFVLIDIIGVTDFWQTAALSFLESLHQTMPRRAAAVPGGHRAACSSRTVWRRPNVRSAIGKLPTEPLTKRSAIELYLTMLKRLDPVNAPRHQDVVRALIYLDSRRGRRKQLRLYVAAGPECRRPPAARTQFRRLGAEARGGGARAVVALEPRRTDDDRGRPDRRHRQRLEPRQRSRQRQRSARRRAQRRSRAHRAPRAWD